MNQPREFGPEVVFAYDVLVSYAKRRKKITYGELYMLADRTAHGGQPVDELGGVVVVAAPDADGPAAQNSQRRLIAN